LLHLTDLRNPNDHGTVAERYLARLREHGIRYLFGNAGTDFPPLIEALSRGDTGIEPVLVPHENVAVAMAYGHAMVTGQPQLVMVHVGLGTANALCGLFNAARQHVPLLLTAGRSPWLEHGRLGARNNYINWAQEMFDQSGMVRELVKWEYELRDPAQVEAVVDRALAAACSAPQGPAYLVLPREVLAAPALPRRDGGTGMQAPVRAGMPSAQDLDTAARWLAGAQRPLIITADTGRTREGFEALTALAHSRGIPVVQYRPRYLSLPCSSPSNAGYDPTRLLPEADLVLAIDVDVPWLPEHCAPQQGTRVVHIGLDPLFMAYPIRGFRSDLSLQGDTASILQALQDATRGAPVDTAGWLDRATRAHRAAVAPAQDEAKLTNRYVSRCIAEAMDERSVLINEYTFALEELRQETHGNYFGHSPAGGLGWGVGAAMGVRMARPDATVFAAVGDGTYMFSNPTPAHYVSAARGLPFITVIYNNRRWAAVHRATLSMYPDGAAAKSDKPVFATLEPEIAHERIVEACGGLGLRVDRAEQLQEAIARAVHAVRHEGRQAVINVLTDVSYTRTS
jgi:acetolactate synthase I/II/III large subunit